MHKLLRRFLAKRMIMGAALLISVSAHAQIIPLDFHLSASKIPIETTERDDRIQALPEGVLQQARVRAWGWPTVPGLRTKQHSVFESSESELAFDRWNSP